MVEKRQLNDEEKALIMRNIPIIRNEVEYIEKVVLPKTLVGLECAPYEYAKQIKDLETRKKECEAQIAQAAETIKILEDQMANGVEPKVQQEKTE